MERPGSKDREGTEALNDQVTIKDGATADKEGWSRHRREKSLRGEDARASKETGRTRRRRKGGGINLFFTGVKK